ncbi:MAG TPA: GerMN domain-containing protein [Verrucomicrobiae bacterium]|nr:GerMN domain-containing protein [Verrucomicrobiae bacterium]
MRRHGRQIGTGGSVLLTAFLIVAAVLGALMMQRYHSREDAPAPRGADEEVYSVSLFFAARDGSGLVRETRPLEVCEEDDECVWEAVTELVKGPLGDLAPVLPAQTVLNDVRLQGDTAVLDFSRGLVEGLPAGSSAEMTAVYAVTDTVAWNFPQIKKVVFVVEGEPLESLGHLDLRGGTAPDFKLERPSGAEGGR